MEYSILEYFLRASSCGLRPFLEWQKFCFHQIASIKCNFLIQNPIQENLPWFLEFPLFQYINFNFLIHFPIQENFPKILISLSIFLFKKIFPKNVFIAQTVWKIANLSEQIGRPTLGECLGLISSAEILLRQPKCYVVRSEIKKTV